MFVRKSLVNMALNNTWGPVRFRWLPNLLCTLNCILQYCMQHSDDYCMGGVGTRKYSAPILDWVVLSVISSSISLEQHRASGLVFNIK